jgi:hypothetical protein
MSRENLFFFTVTGWHSKLGLGLSKQPQKNQRSWMPVQVRLLQTL